MAEPTREDLWKWLNEEIDSAEKMLVNPEYAQLRLITDPVRVRVTMLKALRRIVGELPSDG